MAENPNNMLPFCQWNLHDDGQPIFQDGSVYYVWLHVYWKCARALLYSAKKVLTPKPDQPNRLLWLCKERSLKLLQSIFQCSCIKMQQPTTWHQHALHAHAALPTSLPSTTLHTHKQQMQRKEVVWYNIGRVSKQACSVPPICIMLFESSMQNYFAEVLTDGWVIIRVKYQSGAFSWSISKVFWL